MDSIFIGKSENNDNLILKHTPADYKDVKEKTILWIGGKIINVRDIPLEDYFKKAKSAHINQARELIKSELVTLWAKYSGASTKEAKQVVTHDMNQWLDSVNDFVLFFEAHGTECPEFLDTLISEITKPFPNTLTFTEH